MDRVANTPMAALLLANSTKLVSSHLEMQTLSRGDKLLTNSL